MNNFYVYILFGINILLFIILIIMHLNNKSKIKRLMSKYNKFMNSFGEKNIEELLEACIKNIEDFNIKLFNNSSDINLIKNNLMQCIQKVSIERFNAFENVGSNLSYSIALLDNYNNGVVISSIYSRDASSTYAKPIEDGKSSFPLSQEEIEAINKALKQHTKLYK